MRRKIFFCTLLAFALTALPLTRFTAVLSASPLPPKAVEGGILFSYEAPEANSVHLAGEFNGWNITQNPLTKDVKTGVWSTVYPLTEGRYEYKFVIDGEWMSGANLAVEVKRDKKGNLFVPEPRAGPNTAYSGKIRFGGNVIGLMQHRRFPEEDRYRLDKPRFHIDLDWDISITKAMNAFLRAEMDSFETNQLSLNLFKSHLDFTPEWGTLRLFNNEKNVQLDDPLRLTDKQVSLRYDTLEFFDQPNPNRALGQKAQGLNFSASPFGWIELMGFYMDKSNTDRLKNIFDGKEDTFVEDQWGVRIKRMFGEIFGLGFSQFSKTGMKWPYADSNNFFPDPATTQGHTFVSSHRFSTLSDGLPVEFFQGWRDQSNTAVELKFQALPDFWLFGEVLIRSEDLKTVRRNGRRSLDLASDISWKLFSENQFLAGGQLKLFEKFILEPFWLRKEQTLGRVLHTAQTSELSAKSDRLGGTLKLDWKALSVGFKVSQERGDPFGGSAYVDPGVFPKLKQFRFHSFISSAPSEVQEEELHFQPYLKAEFGERLQARLLGNFQKSIFRPATTTANTSQYSSALPTGEVSSHELIADLLAKIVGSWYFQASLRYAQHLDDHLLKASGNFFSAYAAIVYKLKKNIYLRLGWGVDPEGFDEDLKEDFDERERFLYNRFTEALARGETRSQAIVTAERELESEKRVSLRMEIKF